MKEIIGNVLNEVYEILLRTLVFLIVSYGVTLLMTLDVLTGLLWVTLNHWVYGLILADVGLLIVIPFFSPATIINVVSIAKEYINSLEASYKDTEISIDSLFKEEEQDTYPCFDRECQGTIRKKEDGTGYQCDTCGKEYSNWSIEYDKEWRRGDYHDYVQEEKKTIEGSNEVEDSPIDSDEEEIIREMNRIYEAEGGTIRGMALAKDYARKKGYNPDEMPFWLKTH